MRVCCEQKGLSALARRGEGGPNGDRWARFDGITSPPRLPLSSPFPLDNTTARSLHPHTLPDPLQAPSAPSTLVGRQCSTASSQPGSPSPARRGRRLVGLGLAPPLEPSSTSRLATVDRAQHCGGAVPASLLENRVKKLTVQHVTTQTNTKHNWQHRLCKSLGLVPSMSVSQERST